MEWLYIYYIQHIIYVVGLVYYITIMEKVVIYLSYVNDYGFDHFDTLVNDTLQWHKWLCFGQDMVDWFVAFKLQSMIGYYCCRLSLCWKYFERIPSVEWFLWYFIDSASRVVCSPGVVVCIGEWI